MVIEMVVAADGSVSKTSVYRALVRNQAQLTYNGVGAWLEGHGQLPPKVAASADLQAQLKLQDEAAPALREQAASTGRAGFRPRGSGAGDSERPGESTSPRRQANRATRLIEDFMIAANGVMARDACGCTRFIDTARREIAGALGRVSSNWLRSYGEKLPAQPDAQALNAFLQKRGRRIQSTIRTYRWR